MAVILRNLHSEVQVYIVKKKNPGRLSPFFNQPRA